MKHLIRKCPACGAYSLSHECPKCKAATIDPHPPRYSPDDKYIRYRVAERYADDNDDVGGDKDYK